MRPSMANIRSIGNPSSTYRWGINFIKLPSLGYISLVTNKELNFRCISTDIPKASGSSIPVNIRGYKTKIPGDWNYTGTITVTFVETDQQYVSLLLKMWRDMCWDVRTGVQGSKADVEGTVLLTRLDSKDNEVWLYTLNGVFLEDYDPGGQLTGDSDILRPTATLSFDHFSDGPVFGLNPLSRTESGISSITGM